MAEGNSSHYQVLRVSVTATDKEIKQAYRKAARKAHPDHGGDAEIFRRVTLAYETLIDPRRRAEYDRRYAANTPAPGRSGAAAYEGPASGSATSAGVRRPQSPQHRRGRPGVRSRVR